MDIFKEDGAKGRVYYVYDAKKMKRQDAIETAAFNAKVAKSKMKVIPVWVKKNTLYTAKETGAVKMMAVIRQSKSA